MVGVWYVYRQAWPQGPCNYPSHCRCLSVSLRPGDLTRVEQCDSPVPACLSWGGCGLCGEAWQPAPLCSCGHGPQLPCAPSVTPCHSGPLLSVATALCRDTAV